MRNNPPPPLTSAMQNPQQQRRLPGAPGLNLGGVNPLRPPGFPGVQQQQPASSYNPTGEILAMINKGQGLGLGLGQNQGMGLGGGLPQGLGQGLGPGQPHGLGLGGMPMPDQIGGGGMGGGAFDMSDFPSLGPQRSTVSAGLQQFRSQVHPGPNAAEFAIQSEDFPALPGAAPPSTSGSSGVDGIGGIGGGGIGGGGIEAVLSLSKDGLPRVDEALARGDRFGLMGLLSVIRMSDQDLTMLALGTDLTTLGLNLNAPDSLYATFASPWADGPAQRDPEFNLPQCYYMQPPVLKTGHFSKFQLETLFYIFYNMPRDTLQAYAATELYNRDWRYHKDLKLWFTRASRQGAHDSQKGQYIYFDINEWKKNIFLGGGEAALGAASSTGRRSPGGLLPPGAAPDEVPSVPGL